MIYLLILYVGLVVLAIVGFGAWVSRLVAHVTVPPRQTRYGDLTDSQPYASLRAEGYSVTPDWSSNAVAGLTNESK